MAETNIILWLQTLSNPVLDYIMLGLTQLGSEILFLVAAVILYWCVDKKFAFQFMNVYILGVSLNEGLKAIIRRPRPFVAHPDEIRSIGDPTHGYSMPSGHSQSIANVSVQVCRRFKGTKAGAVLLPFGVYLTIIVMFTRMYLGQHYLTDVLAGCAVGILSALLFSRLFDFLGDREHWLFVAVLPLTVLAAALLAGTGTASSVPDVMKVLGGYGAVTVGYFVEKRFVRYAVRTGAKWKYAVRLLLGLAVTLALKEGLKYAFPENNAFLYGYLRYFIVAIWASLGAPALFKIARI